MFVLVVEDKMDFVDDIQSMLSEMPGPPTVKVALSRDAAFTLIEAEFFDLIILDLRIPTKDGGIDDMPQHGHAVFGKARAVAPGTPILVLTGSPVEDFVETLLQQKQDVDIWSEGRKAMTVDILKKYEFEKCPARLQPIATAIRALGEIELQRTGIDLSIEDDRLIRIFARKFGGTRCIISRLGGGLSGALVVRIRITDAGGARVHDAVAKLGSPSVVNDECDRFDRLVSRLDAHATPRKLATLDYGARARAGIFYGLAEGFDQTAFEAATGPDIQIARVIRSVEAVTARWLQDVAESRRTIREIRQRLLSDKDQSEVLRKFPMAWAPEFEAHQIQTKWSCVHGDLHGSNILVASDGRVVLIDYGDVGEGQASLDPVTLELSVLFHPQRSQGHSKWPSIEQAAHWGDLDLYLIGCPIASFIRECREWALRVAAGNREVAASAYAYLLRQLKYDDTNKDLALALLTGVKAYFDGT
jgi:CheY-like chemotaxis protein